MFIIWLLDFEFGNGSSKQEISKYFVKYATLNLLTQNSANWGSSNQGNIVIYNFDSQQGQEIFLFFWKFRDLFWSPLSLFNWYYGLFPGVKAELTI